MNQVHQLKRRQESLDSLSGVFKNNSLRLDRIKAVTAVLNCELNDHVAKMEEAK
jgi:hypothetical protein